jgi:hypothetical protein
MSTQIRYRTLVNHLARIYEASDETRTGCLQEGLTKVLETINPDGSDGWQQVKVDSMRLLRVWRAREDCQGDSTLADQILEALSDFATEDVPRLEISERPTVAAIVVTPPSEPAVLPKPVPVEKALTSDEAAAIEAALAAIDDEEAEEEEAAEPVVSDDEEEDEETEEDTEDEVEPEVIAPAPTPVVSKPVAAPAPAAEEEDVVEPESDSEDEEAEEETEEEEGVEVEKRTIRGREYWLSSDGTLYAVAEDDEIGDEVGRINKDGRPVFLAPK